MLKAHLQNRLSGLPVNEGRAYAVAFSGGGDSLALLHALGDDPRAKFAFIVDHNLRADSRAEAERAREQAVSLGYETEILTWQHNHPKTGVQEKARLARYALLGQACREHGIDYLLTGHTQDDQAETLLMRYERKTEWRGAAGMAEASYGALWPQLALVTLVRPLLSISRAALRSYNRDHKLNWSEDPSNQNRDFARIRARDYLAEHPDMRAHLLEAGQELRRARDEELRYLRELAKESVSVSAQGLISLSQLSAPELTRYLLQAVSGQGRPIDKLKIRRLHENMRRAEFKSATLAGAMVMRHKGGYLLTRDPVAISGRSDGNLSPRILSWSLTDTPQIWDGRFAVSGLANISVTPMQNVWEQAHSFELGALFEGAPKIALRSLPAFLQKGEIIGLGGQGEKEAHYRADNLAQTRLKALLKIGPP